MRIRNTGILHDHCLVLRYLLQPPICLAHFLDELLHLLEGAHHPRPHLLRLQLQQVVLVTLVPPVVLYQGNINAWRPGVVDPDPHSFELLDPDPGGQK
jgi:hypothetical protein